MGVLDALRIYASCISCLAKEVALKCRWTCDNLCLEATDEFLKEDMAYRKDIVNSRKKKTVVLQKRENTSGRGGGSRSGYERWNLKLGPGNGEAGRFSDQFIPLDKIKACRLCK